jgi:hypothetical protein
LHKWVFHNIPKDKTMLDLEPNYGRNFSA